MKINKLTLQNFRGFDSRELTFNHQFTVLVGENGRGKTAILESLTIALGAYLSGFNGIKSRYIRKDEIYKKYDMFGKKIDIQPQYPVVVGVDGELNGEVISWSREINEEGGTTTSKNAKSIMKFATHYQQQTREFEEVVLPIVSYYSTQRLYGQKNSRVAKLKHNRLEAYENVLDPLADVKSIFKWIEDMRYIELQEEEPAELLMAVNSAIKGCVENCQDVRYDVKYKQLMIVKADEQKPIPFDLLSDGYRSVIGLVADLASRMAMLNPFLGEDVCKLTPGIVLIDELDLHLHPRWQRKIVDDLKSVFPKVQFITTTHSPFIIQSLNAGELRRLKKEDDDENVPSEEFVSRSIEDISEDVMDMTGVQRSEKLNAMYKAAQEYYTLLDQGKNENDRQVQRIKQKLDEIESLYSSDVAYYAFLKMERKAAGLGDEK